MIMSQVSGSIETAWSQATSGGDIFQMIECDIKIQNQLP